MPVQYSVPTLDGLNDEVSKLYEADPSGGFRLSVEGLPNGQPAADPSAELLNALQNERKSVSRLEADLKSWQKLGETPDAVKTKIAELQEARGDPSEGEKMLAQAQEKHVAEIAKIEAERDAALAAEHSAVVESGFTAALAKAGFTETGMEMIPKLHSQRVRMVERDGSRLPEIMLADGITPKVGQGANARATFDDLAAELSEKYPDLVRSDRRGGGATPPGNERFNSENQTMKRTEWQALPHPRQGELIRSGVTLID